MTDEETHVRLQLVIPPADMAAFEKEAEKFDWDVPTWMMHLAREEIRCSSRLLLQTLPKIQTLVAQIVTHQDQLAKQLEEREKEEDDEGEEWENGS